MSDGAEHADPIDKLVGETELVFQCGVAASDQFDEDDPEHCSHEPETIELDEPAWRDEMGLIVFPGRPKECPVCGNPIEFEINGVMVGFHP